LCLLGSEFLRRNIEAFASRFKAGIRYFFAVYRHRVDEWALYDNDSPSPLLLASGDNHGEDILDGAAWKSLRSIGLGNSHGDGEKISK
jgi:hypothetical protein